MADIFLARGKACTLAANYKQCTCNKRRTAFAHRQSALGPRRTGGKVTNNRFISLTGRPPPAAHLPNVKETRGTTLSRHMTRSYKQQLEQPCRSTAPQSLPEAPRVASQCTSVCGRVQLLSRARGGRARPEIACWHLVPKGGRFLIVRQKYFSV